MHDRSIRIAVLVLDLHLPFAHSLKEKRRVVRSLLDRVRTKHHLSAAEVGGQDLHQRASVAFCAVGSMPVALEQLLDLIVSEAERELPAGVEVVQREILG